MFILQNIKTKIALLFLLIFNLGFATVDTAKVDINSNGTIPIEKDLKTEIKEQINHHLLDSYDFHLLSWKDNNQKEHHVGFPLPVILYDNGLHIFSSSKFHHGETVVESKGNFYKLYHGKIYKTGAEGTLSYAPGP